MTLMNAMDEALMEHVLRAAECVPPGRTASYGLIASIVGTGARQVGAVMAAEGGGVPWWRVTNAQGRLPAHLLARARAHWASEGTPLRPDSDGVASAAVVDPDEFTEAVRAATANLPPLFEPQPTTHSPK